MTLLCGWRFNYYRWSISLLYFPVIPKRMLQNYLKIYWRNVSGCCQWVMNGLRRSTQGTFSSCYLEVMINGNGQKKCCFCCFSTLHCTSNDDYFLQLRKMCIVSFVSDLLAIISIYETFLQYFLEMFPRYHMHSNISSRSKFSCMKYFATHTLSLWHNTFTL